MKIKTLLIMAISFAASAAQADLVTENETAAIKGWVEEKAGRKPVEEWLSAYGYMPVQDFQNAFPDATLPDLVPDALCRARYTDPVAKGETRIVCVEFNKSGAFSKSTASRWTPN